MTVKWLLGEEREGAISRALGRIRARAYLRGCTVEGAVFVGGYVRVRVAGEARIGPGVRFAGGRVPTELSVADGATLSIGADTLLDSGVSLDARQEIRLGARCRVGAGVRVLNAGGDRRGPVRIGDDVWLSAGAIIGPSVTIGDGAMVGAGAVVTSDVPANTRVIGNPARSAGPPPRPG